MTKPFNIGLVLANFDELLSCYSQGENGEVVPSHGFWQKAVLLSQHEEYILVSPAVPSNLTPESGAWFAPGSIIVPSPTSSQLCRNLLNDNESLNRLFAELSSKSQVRIWAQVFSPGVTAIVEALGAKGLNVDTSELPLVSPQSVAYLNTKVGGREFLQRIPSVRKSLPAALVCNTLSEVVSTLVTTDMNHGLVVKANSSIGGSGVWMFPPGLPRKPEEIREVLTTPRKVQAKGSKSIQIAEELGPFLVEEMVGVPGVNLSPTADFNIQSNGVVNLVGIGEQILINGASYTGCRYPVGGDQSQVESCITLGNQICFELHRRGYRGLANLDFVILQNGNILVAEMNLRQSAPLDQFLVMQRLFGEKWEQSKSFVCVEDAALKLSAGETHALFNLLDGRLHMEFGDLVQPLAIYTNRETTERQVSLLSAADSKIAAEKLANSARVLVGGG